ncbi:c-type cytochrome domain-containing protein, partial [uncultured Nocardioides sp.]|uniref:c-type cytochrome domain-containing protein n=1 Tax=uncultured Nocardioides sp. TaxID=198441 RepID=UPI0026055F1D
MPRILLITILLLPIGVSAAPDFSREVLPIFSDNCFQCHGPDANARKAKLRLDTSAGIFSVRESGRRVVVAREAGSSLL